MSQTTFFLQSCPTCGRKLQIRVEYLGKSLHCQHCRGELLASDHQAAEFASAAVLRRAEELLESPAEQKVRPR